MADEIQGELSLQGGRGSSWLLHLIKIWGPAWLVMIADVDAASVITAAESGAQQGTHLIWFLLVLTLPLYVIHEVAGRMGAVTGKGLGELIRENYSRCVAVLIGPAIILGLICANKRLMGVHSLAGFNRILYWAFLVLIVGTGFLSLAQTL